MSDSDGRQAFFWLSAAILGGALFAAGVLVGRQTASQQPESGLDPLGRIDRRDQPSPGPDGQALHFPELLSGPPARPALRPPKPVPVPPADDAARVTRDGGAVEVAVSPSDGGGAPPSPSPAPLSTAPDAGAGVVPATGEQLCLQVASYREETQARALADRLNQAGYQQVRVFAGEVPGKGTYFRVRLGRYHDRAAAEILRERFEGEEGLRAIVIQSEE